MAGKNPARNGLLLQTLKNKLVSFDAEGSQTALPQQMFAGPGEPERDRPNADLPQGSTVAGEQQENTKKEPHEHSQCPAP